MGKGARRGVPSLVPLCGQLVNAEASPTCDLPGLPPWLERSASAAGQPGAAMLASPGARFVLLSLLNARSVEYGALVQPDLQLAPAAAPAGPPPRPCPWRCADRDRW